METRQDAAAAHKVVLDAAAKGVSTSWDPYLGELPEDLIPPEANFPLPTNGDALRYYLHLKRGKRMNDKSADVISLVVSKVKLFWDAAQIPTLDHPISKPKRHLAKLLFKFEKFKKHKKFPDLYEKECREFHDLCSKLLDMAHPQANYKINSCRFRSAAKKLSDIEFLQDQRTVRRQVCGAVDNKYSSQVANKQQRLQAASNYRLRESSAPTPMSSVSPVPPLSDSNSSTDSSGDEYVPESPCKKMKRSQPNILKSPEFHKLADRFKWSHRSRTVCAGVSEMYVTLKYIDQKMSRTIQFF